MQFALGHCLRGVLCVARDAFNGAIVTSAAARRSYEMLCNFLAVELHQHLPTDLYQHRAWRDINSDHDGKIRAALDFLANSNDPIEPRMRAEAQRGNWEQFLNAHGQTLAAALQRNEGPEILTKDLKVLHNYGNFKHYRFT